MKYLGVFAEQLGIRPWEWGELNASEVIGLMRYIDNQQQEASDG